MDFRRNLIQSLATSANGSSARLRSHLYRLRCYRVIGHDSQTKQSRTIAFLFFNNLYMIQYFRTYVRHMFHNVLYFDKDNMECTWSSTNGVLNCSRLFVYKPIVNLTFDENGMHVSEMDASKTSLVRRSISIFASYKPPPEPILIGIHSEMVTNILQKQNRVKWLGRLLQKHWELCCIRMTKNNVWYTRYNIEVSLKRQIFLGMLQ